MEIDMKAWNKTDKRSFIRKEKQKWQSTFPA